MDLDVFGVTVNVFAFKDLERSPPLVFGEGRRVWLWSLWGSECSMMELNMYFKREGG